VIVPDKPSLDPGVANFSFGVRLSMLRPPEVGETYDALRKGLAGTAGGSYKVEIKPSSGYAVARCVVKDSSRVSVAIQSQATASANLANGQFHTVTCAKSNTGVSVKVDGLAPRTKTVDSLGSVASASHLALGAKAESSATTGFDWFTGRTDEAWVSVG
jgi:hypothetical protein